MTAQGQKLPQLHYVGAAAKHLIADTKVIDRRDRRAGSRSATVYRVSHVLSGGRFARESSTSRTRRSPQNQAALLLEPLFMDSNLSSLAGTGFG